MGDGFCKQRLLRLLQHVPQNELLMRIRRRRPVASGDGMAIAQPESTCSAPLVAANSVQQATAANVAINQRPCARAGRGRRPSIGIINLGHSCGFSLIAIPFGLASYRMQVMRSVAIVLRRSKSQASPETSYGATERNRRLDALARHERFRRDNSPTCGVRNPPPTQPAHAQAHCP